MTLRIPDAATLVAASADFVETTLYPGLAGEERYLCRVAINALRIVQRELALGPAADARDRDSQREFLGDAAAQADPGGVLTNRIHEGRLDLDDPRLIALLRDGLRRSLEINNPKWLD